MNFLNSEGLSRVQTHIQTALDMKADKLQVEKQFTDSVADWNQNDEFAPDYVKNRTHYKTISEKLPFTAYEITFENQTLEFEEYYGSYKSYISGNNENYKYPLSNAIYYIVFDDIEYECRATRGDLYTEDFSIYFYEEGLEIYHRNIGAGSHTLSIYEVIETYYQLPSKYLAEQVIELSAVYYGEDYDQCYYEINNKTYDEMVELFKDLVSGRATTVPYVIIKNDWENCPSSAQLLFVTEGDIALMQFMGPINEEGIALKVDIRFTDQEIYVSVEDNNVLETTQLAINSIESKLSEGIYLNNIPTQLPITADWLDIDVQIDDYDDEYIIITTGGDLMSYHTSYSDNFEWSIYDTSSLNASVAWKATATAEGNTVITSTNQSDKIGIYNGTGLNQKSVLPRLGNWDSIAYLNNKYIVLDGEISNTGYYSENNGYAWNEISLPVNAGWGQLLSINNRGFIALANKDDNNNEGSNLGMYSMDGINWTTFTMPEAMVWTSLFYDDMYENIYAVGYNTSLNKTVCYRSSYFGGSWKSTRTFNEIRTNPFILGKNEQFFYGNYLTLKNNSTVECYDGLGSTTEPVVASLPEGVEWVKVKYFNNIFVALGKNTNKIAYSKNGINWTSSEICLFDNKGRDLNSILKDIIIDEPIPKVIFRIWDIPARMITFTIEHDYGETDHDYIGTFTVPEGYTWYEFCNSEYNPNNAFSADEDYVYVDNGNLLDPDYIVSGNDIIIANGTYVVIFPE